MPDPSLNPDEKVIVERLRSELERARPTRKRRAIEKFFLAALGSIPWVGGFLSAAAAFKVEEASLRSPTPSRLNGSRSTRRSSRPFRRRSPKFNDDSRPLALPSRSEFRAKSISA